jgi:hypothetical protein
MARHKKREWDREVIEFGGRKFYRHPNSKDHVRRKYFMGWDGQKPLGLHVAVWESVHGKVPPRYHVHHKDHDTLNNDISNLECLSPADHARSHKDHLDEMRPKAAYWFKTPEGQAFLRKAISRGIEDKILDRDLIEN